MSIIAPFDGVVVDLPYFTPGNKIDSGAELVTIMDYDHLYMEFQLPEKNIAELAVNQHVRILNYTLPDDTLSGTISQLSPAINPDTRNFKGTFLINNPDLKLRPGSYVKAEIVTMRRDSVVVIDKELILSRQRGKSVFVVDNNTANERRITTGLENPQEIEILTGLEVNDRIVIEGFETLGNRSKVKVIR
jgi:RND family efflux transporter MFP subunit